MSSDSSSGGGIVRGSSSAALIVHDMRSFRRRWAGGVSITTIAHANGFRGVTVSGLMPLSLDPPSIALAFQADTTFQELLVPGTVVGISILDRAMEFLSERFAGRAPVPNHAFTGVPHRVVDDVALIDGSLGWCIGIVRRVDIEGDHVLIIVGVIIFEIPADSDDPLINYEGRYRGLEPS